LAHAPQSPHPSSLPRPPLRRGILPSPVAAQAPPRFTLSVKRFLAALAPLLSLPAHVCCLLVASQLLPPAVEGQEAPRSLRGAVDEIAGV